MTTPGSTPLGSATAPVATRSPRLAALFAALLAVSAIAVLVGCGGSGSTSADETASDAEEQLSGYTRDPVRSVSEISLPLASDGSDMSMAAPPGDLRIVYFGYTNCPDVCPTTMSDLRQALAELPSEDQDRIEVTMATIDPARDLPDKLTAYVQTFIPDGQALWTDDQVRLRGATDAFGANYSVETAADGEVEVGHSAELYAVDDAGDVIMQWPFGIEYPDLAHDLGELLSRQD